MLPLPGQPGSSAGTGSAGVAATGTRSGAGSGAGWAELRRLLRQQQAWMDPQRGMLQGSRASVCLVLSHAKWHSIVEDKDPSLSSPPAAPHGRGVGIKAVQAGAEGVPKAGGLSRGNGQEKR